MSEGAKESSYFETMLMEAVAGHKESLTDGPVEKLIKIYKRTIKELQSIPEQEGYRKALETTTRKRLDICLEERDPEAIERRIGCGKFNDIVQNAKLEFKIVSHLHEWDPWRKDSTYLCAVIDQIDHRVPEPEPPGPIPAELFERLKALAKATCEKDERKTRVSKHSCNEESDEMFSSANNP
uniref:probable NADH dehydrogenase [ubiquinone] 1 alpha subcomplex subunit 5, mitochondrial n=1 Tax=Erigeron canadensis TaxID=72917 RepID=UPI001CB9A9A3|nr:probable NADH dehydrogenase [ubiquinone] 1 alpha subcomplex subunit 5, mitochondrial [Erigeron canadensis]